MEIENQNEKLKENLIKNDIIDSEIMDLYDSLHKKKTIIFKKENTFSKSFTIISMIIFIFFIIFDLLITYYKYEPVFLSFSFKKKSKYHINTFCGIFSIFFMIALLLDVIYCMIFKESFFHTFPNYDLIYGKYYPKSFCIFSFLIIFDLIKKFFTDKNVSKWVSTFYDLVVSFFIFINTYIYLYIYSKIKIQNTKNVFLVIPQNILISLLLALCIYLSSYQFILFFENETLINVLIYIFISIYFIIDIFFLIIYKDIIFTLQSNFLELGLIENSNNLSHNLYITIIVLVSFICCFVNVKMYKKAVFGLQYDKKNSNSLIKNTDINSLAQSLTL